MKNNVLKHTVSYYKLRLSELAVETFDPNPDFPFSVKQTRSNSDVIVEKSQDCFRVYRAESLRGIFKKSLTAYVASISVDNFELDIRIKIKKTVLLFYFAWTTIFLSLVIYLIGIGDFSWMLFAIMLIAACLHLPLGKRKFEKFIIQFLNSL